MMKWDEEYLKTQINRSWFRRIARKYYLKNILNHVSGKSIDFGCGGGVLLGKLPSGSIGFEINKAAVKYCIKKGYKVYEYNSQEDNFLFMNYELHNFDSFILNHVLEHLDDPNTALRNILNTCQRFNIQKVIIVVPGIKGFAIDKTHMVYINQSFFKKNGLERVGTFSISKEYYFPFNHSQVGNFFTYNEFVIIYENDI